jgi:hypothetical protein
VWGYLLLLAQLEMSLTTLSWLLRLFYGPNVDCDRELLWDELVG